MEETGLVASLLTNTLNSTMAETTWADGGGDGEEDE